LLHLPDGHSLGAQFVEGVASDLHGCADRQQRHDAGHDQVRPARPSAEHTQRRQHHGDIAQRIVAAAQPDTAHVAVAFTVGIEHERHGDVGQQCDGADDAHRRGLGHAGIDEVVDRDYQDEQAEQTHGQCLGQRRPGPHDHAHAQHEQADTVVGRIAEEVQRVGQQRDRTGPHAGADLHREHRQVDQQRDPENPPIAPAHRCAGATTVAAISCHVRRLGMSMALR